MTKCYKLLLKKLLLSAFLISSTLVHAVPEEVNLISELSQEILNQGMKLTTLPQTQEGLGRIALYQETLNEYETMIDKYGRTDDEKNRIRTMIQRQRDRLSAQEKSIENMLNPAIVNAPYAAQEQPQADQTEAEECSICFENLETDGDNALLKCGHSFHKKCIDDWFAKQRNCPLCRREFGISEDPFIHPTITTVSLVEVQSPTPAIPMGPETSTSSFNEPHFEGNYYEILGVESDASSKIIRQAYLAHARIHHPDKGGDEENFKLLDKAYKTLIDADKRAAYDQSLTSKPATAPEQRPAAHAAKGKKVGKGKKATQRRKKAARRKVARKKAASRKGKHTTKKRRAQKAHPRKKYSRRRAKVQKARDFDYEESLKKRS